MSTDPLADLRLEYRRAELIETRVQLDPFEQFTVWFAEVQAATLVEPNAMTLATVSPDGQPSARTVLLKGLDRHGFIWYTNYASPKGRDLDANPRAALLFYWKEFERQVRVEGVVAKVSREESEHYFRGRPIGSQLGALSSRQSTVIPNRAALEEEYLRFEETYLDRIIPLPDDWGGYRLTPASFEFWQGRPNRLHDRLRYTRVDHDRWRLERLSP